MSMDVQKSTDVDPDLDSLRPFSSQDRSTAKADGAGAKNAKKELTPDEKKAVEKLKQSDQEVRSHEQAHSAAGGAYVKGGPSFTFQTGPDGRRYAIGGEVSIDTSPIKGDPKATIQKMMTVIKAATAPASPSGQDMAVAAAATQVMTQAQMQLNQARVPGRESPISEKPASKGWSHGYSVKGETIWPPAGKSSSIDFTA